MTLTDPTSAETTFNMPGTDITLTAEHKTIHTLTVVGGIIDENGGDTIQAIEGDTITVHSALAPNQKFLHWKSEDIGLTDSQSKNDTLTITMPDCDVTITAVPKQLYTVTVVNGTVRDKREDTANPGDPVTIKAADKTAQGEVFVRWTVKSTDPNGQPNVELDDPTAESTTFTMVVANVEVEANYEKQYTVTVKYQTETGTPTEDTSQKKTAIFGENIAVTAEDKTADGLIFDHWEVKVGGDTVTDLFTDYESADAAFTMRGDDVTLTAVYKKLYTITITNNVNDAVDSTRKTKVNGTVSLEAALISGYRFKSWKVLSGDAVVSDAGILTLNDDGDVLVQAVYVDLYDLTVTYGTAADANGDVGSAAEGDRITVNADEPYPTETFEGWTLISGTIHDASGNLLTTDKEGYILNADGTRLTKRSFTFVMCNSEVKLKANYSMPAYVMEQRVIVEGGTAFAEGEAAAAEIVADPGKRITVSADPNADSNMIFDYWEVTSLDEDGKATVKLEDATSMTTSFTMPMAPVELTAHWRTIDEAPSSGGDGGAGAAIAGVAIGGAAVWGGYEIATRIILNDLLPAGAAISANRGQLALLIWTEKGKPEPAAQPAFADITDAEQAKAAQWCVEQGLLDARVGKFESDGWMPKFKTIEIWNKAFPKK